MSINEQEGIATVRFPSCEYRRTCKASDILTVPISRLCTPRSEVRSNFKHTTVFIVIKNSSRNLTCVTLLLKTQQALPLYKLSITEKVVQAVQSMLLPQEGSLSIHTSLPATGDGSSPVMAAVRLLAEIRTRLVNGCALCTWYLFIMTRWWMFMALCQICSLANYFKNQNHPFQVNFKAWAVQHWACYQSLRL